MQAHKDADLGWRVVLTKVGIHDEKVEVLLQVTAVLRHFPSQQIKYGTEQVLT